MATSRKNAKKQTSSIKKLGIWTALRSPSVWVAIFFVLAFGAIGGYYLRNSDAASTACTYQTLGPGQDSRCVGDLQSALNSWDGQTKAGYITYVGKYKNYAIAQDDDYGPVTQQDVEDFQRWTNKNCDANQCNYWWTGKLTVDGVVGYNTWWDLCWQSQPGQYNYKYDDVGCAARWGI